MAVSIAQSSSGPGASAPRTIHVVAAGTWVEYPFTVTFDSSYPTGGEDIGTTITNSPWNIMRNVWGITTIPFLAPGGTGGYTAGHTVIAIPDLTNKKLLLMDNNAQVTDTTASQAIVIQCVAYGTR